MITEKSLVQLGEFLSDLVFLCNQFSVRVVPDAKDTAGIKFVLFDPLTGLSYENGALMFQGSEFPKVSIPIVRSIEKDQIDRKLVEAFGKNLACICDKHGVKISSITVCERLYIDHEIIGWEMGINPPSRITKVRCTVKPSNFVRIVGIDENGEIRI